MSAEIEHQAKNEVRNLLNEYVVTPIDSHIQKVLQKSEKSLGSTMGTQTQEMKENLIVQISKLETRLKGTIGGISEKVGTDIPNDIIDSKEEILNSLGTLQGELDKKPDTEMFSRLKTEVSDAIAETGGVICGDIAALSGTVEQRTQAAEETICKQISAVHQELGKKPDTETFSQLEAGITSAVQKSGEEVRQKLASLSGTVEQRTQAAEETICKQISAVHQELGKKPDIEVFSHLEAGITSAVRNSGEEVRQELIALSGTVEQRTQAAEETICKQISAVHQELNEKLENELLSQLETSVEAEKRYKMLLIISLAIGASNLLGIIVLAVLISQFF